MEVIDPAALSSFVAARLIPLAKGASDIRPIGIGESLRRVCSKAVTKALATDIQDATGGIQMCCGLAGGCEAAVHTVKEVFAADEVDAILLVDASNAFNSLNRGAALHNIHRLCPQFFVFLVNMYRVPAIPSLHLGWTPQTPGTKTSPTMSAPPPAFPSRHTFSTQNPCTARSTLSTVVNCLPWPPTTAPDPTLSSPPSATQRSSLGTPSKFWAAHPSTSSRAATSSAAAPSSAPQAFPSAASFTSAHNNSR